MDKTKLSKLELLIKEIGENNADLINQYNSAVDPQIKIELKYELARAIRRDLLLKIAKMKQAEWKRLCKEQAKVLEAALQKIGEEYFKQKVHEKTLTPLKIEFALAEAFTAS